jgi:2-polyprenyl-3-methyl-5-hydroxy-6-metoxy-1,4-benzoquinol methylase
MACGGCGHIFTDGFFEGEAATILFSDGQKSQQVQVNEQERWTASMLIDKVAAPQEVFTLPSPSWLDVGFGSGALVMTAHEFGYETVGLDLRMKNVDALMKLGFIAYGMSLEEYVGRGVSNVHGQYNVISMLDVLEHMPFPRTALDAAHSILTDDGVLVISCPNTDTAVWRELNMKNANPYWVEIEHYHNFSRKNLSLLLEAHGFIPVSYHVSPRYRTCMEIICAKGDAHE